MHLAISKISTIWDQKLKEGSIAYDPSSGLQRKIGMYTLSYLPGRISYTSSVPTAPFTSIDIPHDPTKDVFCANKDEINHKQKMLELKIRGNTWDLLVNKHPIESLHCMLLPHDKQVNQLMTLDYLEDFYSFLQNNPDTTLAYNSMGAAASQNHFHIHVFFNTWSLDEIKKIPLKKVFFSLQDIRKLYEYLTNLHSTNTPYNLIMEKEAAIVTPRRKEQVKGVKFGPDAVSGRFKAQSLEQFHQLTQRDLEKILEQIGFPEKSS